MSGVKLPYYAREDKMPADLPCIEEINGSLDVLKKKSGQTVVRIAPHFVVKYGTGVTLEEGQTMIYVREMSGIVAPRVYAVFRDDRTNKNYIIMENIPDLDLHTLWPTLSPDQKTQICELMKKNIRLMRDGSLLSCYCSLDGAALRHDFFRSTLSGRWMFYGPFVDDKAFNSFLFHTYLGSLNNDNRGFTAEFYANHTSAILYDHPGVFTHGDLQRSNILVQILPDSNIGGITIVDWEYAGWYPRYWEYVMAVRGCGPVPDDWLGNVEQILQPFPHQWVWMKTMMAAVW